MEVILLKIEKLNDKQIRCTLSKEDLYNRNILPSDLRYGSSKTKKLFNEVLKSAYERFEFSKEDSALTIEAIPSEDDAVDILITKENFPEEMDTRFAEFSNSDISVPVVNDSENTSCIINPKELYNSFISKNRDVANNETTDKKIPVEKPHYFLFVDMENLIKAAKIIAPIFKGKSSLVRLTKNNIDKFILILYYKDNLANKFDYILVTLSDFDVRFIINRNMQSSIIEHSNLLIKNDAVSKLASL